MKSKNYKLFLIILLTALLSSCSFINLHCMYSQGKKLVEKHGITTDGKYATEKIYSNTRLNNFYYDKAFIIDNVFISDTLFNVKYQCDGMPIKAIRNPLDYISEDNEEYLVLYRTYIDYCDDWIGETAFIILINLVNDIPNLSKSVAMFDSGEVPHLYWDMDSVSFQNDSLHFEAINSYTGEPEYFKAKLVIDSTYSVTQYKNHIDEYSEMVDKLRRF